MEEGDVPVGRTAEADGAGGSDLKVKAAWLYYVEGLTQEQIARHLAISRLKVLRMLSACNQEGIVRIHIQGETASQVALERSLEKAFDLKAAIVVPSPVDQDQLPRVLGYATGQQISSVIQDDMAIGVGWGATLHHSLASLSRRPTSKVSVVSLLGGLIHSQWINPSLFAWRMAEAFGAESFQLTSPIHVRDAELRRRLWQEPQLRELRERADHLDMAFVGVGEISETSTLFRNGILPRTEMTSLRASGAVGEVLSQFIDAEGRTIDHEVNRRVMAIDLETLRRTPKVVIVAGGKKKIEAIKAALRATTASTLITDANTAVDLLALGAH